MQLRKDFNSIFAKHKIAKDGAKMIKAVANSEVPKFTIIRGNSFGAGNYVMCSRVYNPRFLFMYLNAKIAVTKGEQAALTLLTVKKQQLKNKGITIDSQKRKEFSKEIIEKYEYESSAYYSSARIWDDNIIDPIQSRKNLRESYKYLHLQHNKPIQLRNIQNVNTFKL